MKPARVAVQATSVPNTCESATSVSMTGATLVAVQPLLVAAPSASTCAGLTSIHEQPERATASALTRTVGPRREKAGMKRQDAEAATWRRDVMASWRRAR